MNRETAVWIDKEEARIYHVRNGAFDQLRINAPSHHVHRHPRRELTAEKNHPDDLRHLFADVARLLSGAERILIMGPSTTKAQFARYLRENAPQLERCILGVESADHPTDSQLVAYARRYFRAPHGHARP